MLPCPLLLQGTCLWFWNYGQLYSHVMVTIDWVFFILHNEFILQFFNTIQGQRPNHPDPPVGQHPVLVFLPIVHPCLHDNRFSALQAQTGVFFLVVMANMIWQVFDFYLFSHVFNFNFWLTGGIHLTQFL